MRRLAAAVVACWLLLATVGVPAAAFGTDTPAGEHDLTAGTVRDRTASATAVTQPPEGVVRHTLRLDEPGSVAVTLGVGITDRTRRFRVTLPEQVTVTGTTGFDRVEGATYEWDGRTAAPRLTYRAPVNRTVGGSTRFAATADWALVDMTELDAAYSWRSLGETSYERQFAAPNGYAGTSMAYLGDYSVANASAAGQRFTVVRPSVVATGASASAYAETLASIAREFRIGARDPVVTAFVAPPPVGANGGEGGVGGLATSADMWIAADSAARTEANGTRVHEPIFVHEYVHTRQAYEPGADMQWFTESSAFYYMGLTPYQRGTTSRDRFDRRFRVPDRYRDAVLTETTGSQYRVWATKGARTLAGLDRRIRASTDGSRSLQDVFRRLNDRNGTVTYEDFRAIVAETAGESTADWLDRHVDGPSLAPDPVPDAYPGPNVTVDAGRTEWRRGDAWVSVSTTPLPAGVPVRVRHPEVGVVVRPAGATTAVNDSGGDPATVRLPAGEATLRVETFYGRNATTLSVPTSEDVDGDGVSNAAELDQESDPYDAGSSTASGGGPLDGDSGSDGGSGPAFGDGPGLGPAGTLAALALVVAWLGTGRRRRD